MAVKASNYAVLSHHRTAIALQIWEVPVRLADQPQSIARLLHDSPLQISKLFPQYQNLAGAAAGTG